MPVLKYKILEKFLRIKMPIVFLSLWAIGGCGDHSTDVTFNFSYDSNAAAIIGDGTGISVRAFYSFDNLIFQDANGGSTRAFILEPSSADFKSDVDTQGHTTFRQNTAKAPGYNAQSGTFTLHSMSLNHTGTFFGIDFLKQLSDGQYYVVAVGCFQKSEGALSKDLLQSFTSQTLVIKRGRNCGTCDTIDDYGITVENAKNPCP
jgi:hypothetical protein